MSKLTSQALFFLMTVCHQPYSEALKIPLEDVNEMFQLFQDLLEQFFGKSQNHKNLKRIASNIDIKAFEKLWAPKEDHT